jgi:hypothetical protein
MRATAFYVRRFFWSSAGSPQGRISMSGKAYPGRCMPALRKARTGRPHGGLLQGPLGCQQDVEVAADRSGKSLQ